MAQRKTAPRVGDGQAGKSDPKLPATDAERFFQLLGKDPACTWFRNLTPTPGKGSLPNVNRGGRDLQGFDQAALEADNHTASIYFITGDTDQASGKAGAVTDADVHSCRSVFVEWDDKPIEWQMQAWRELGLPEPTAMVQTGGKSVHCYWRLAEPMAPAEWRTLQARLIAYTGGDSQCKNPSRLMRLPGFRYIDKATGKPTDRRAELIHQAEVSYTVAEIEACLPAPAEQQPIITKPANGYEPRGIDDINAAAQYIPRRIGDQGTYFSDRNALCGCSAALAAAGVADADGAALALLGHLWPSESAARQVLESTTTRNAASFWAIARVHGFDLGREAKVSAPKKAQQQPARRKEHKPRKLGHTRAMACFDRCVEVLAKHERNSLRRRARLLMIAKALNLSACVNRQDIAQRVLEAKDEHQGNSYLALTAAERLSMVWPEVDWLVPDLIPANDLVIIGGRPKVGKTAVAMAIAAAVLKGQSVAGCDAPQTQRPVILVSDDQGDADTVRAMRQLGIDDHQSLLWSRRFRLTEQDLDKLLADVAQHPGAVVIIDSLRSVARALPHGENDAEIGAVIYDLKAAVTDAGGSLLLVHHCNKSAGLTGVEALSGHNAIAGAANTVITLHHVEDEKGRPCKEAVERRLVREGRTGKPLDWVISRTAGTPTFHKVCTYTEWVAQVEDAAKQAKRESRQTSTQAEVLEALAAANGQLLTCRQVVEAMGLEWGDRGNGKDPSRVREALNRLADEGEIQRVRSGTQYTFAAASHGTQIVSDTSTTSAALPHKGSERRDQPRQTSAPVKCSASADSCRDVPRHRKALQRSAAEVPEASEAQGSHCQELVTPGTNLVGLMEVRRDPGEIGSGASTPHPSGAAGEERHAHRSEPTSQPGVDLPGKSVEVLNTRTNCWEANWRQIGRGRGSSVLCSDPSGESRQIQTRNIRPARVQLHLGLN